MATYYQTKDWAKEKTVCTQRLIALDNSVRAHSDANLKRLPSVDACCAASLWQPYWICVAFPAMLEKDIRQELSMLARRTQALG